MLEGFNRWESALGMDPEQTAEAHLARQIRDEQQEHLVNIQTQDEYSLDTSQVADLAKTDLNFLAGLAMPSVFRYPFPRMFLLCWQMLVEATSKWRDFSKYAIGIPRGFAKTTFIKLFILFVILFTNRRFILITCSTAAHAENIISDVIDMLDSYNIKAVFGDWKLGLTVNRADLKKFSYRGRVIVIAGMGAHGSVRGFNLGNERPDIMLFDDVQTRECADSKVQSDALENWLFGTAMYANSPNGCIYIFVGNIYPTPYSILRKLKSNPAWIKFISGGILSDGTSIWEDLKPITVLIEMLNDAIGNGHPEIFFSEIMNDTEAGINTKIDLSKLQAWPYGEHDEPQGRFIVVDPSNNKAKGDLVSIGYFEVFDATPSLVDLIEDRLSPGNTIRQALILALRNKCTVIGVESTAFQFSLLYWFDYISKEIGLSGIDFVEVYTGSVSKNTRISGAINQLMQKELYLHPRVIHQVQNQLIHWNPLKRDNDDGILDLLTYAQKMIENYGALMTREGNIISLEYQNCKVATVSENCAF